MYILEKIKTGSYIETKTLPGANQARPTLGEVRRTILDETIKYTDAINLSIIFVVQRQTHYDFTKNYILS